MTTPLTSEKVRKLTSVLILIGLITGVLFLATSATSQEATDTAVSKDEIEESIKDRLEKALQESSGGVHLRRAWVGPLESIANHTLTIETRDGPKLASISAETQFVSLPERSLVEVEDLVIGAHTIAMGNINGNKVLEAIRVLVYDDPPKPSRREALFAVQLEYDALEDELIFTLNSGESRVAEVTSETVVTMVEEGKIAESEVEKLEETNRAILIIKTDEDETSSTLLRIHLLKSAQQESPQQENGLREATDSPPAPEGDL